MAFKTLNGKAPGPGARMATKPAGTGGTAKQGQITSGTLPLPKRGPGSATSPPKSAIKKGGNGQFAHPKGTY